MLSDHFDLTHFPFSVGTELNGLFECPQFESTYNELLMGVLDGRRIQVVVGPGGIGRTSLLSRMRSGLQPSEFQVISVAFTNLNLDELLSLILRALNELVAVCTGDAGHEAAALGEEREPREELRRRLRLLRESGRPVVFLIDDAEDLGAPILNQFPELLDDEDDSNLAQAVLAVRPEFAQRLTGIELDCLNAAIDGILPLDPWDRTSVTDYVCAAIESASGVAGEIFTEEAIEALYQHSGGIPTKINTLCGSAMSEAETQGKRRVTPEHVHAAAAGLLAALDSPADDEPLFGDTLELDDLSALTLEAGQYGARRPRRSTLIERVAGWAPKWKPSSGEGTQRRRIPAVATGGAVVVVGGLALFIALSTSDPIPDTRAALQSPATPAFSGSKIKPAVDGRATSDTQETAESQVTTLDELADTVRALSRTLVSIEARLGSYESEMTSLKQAVTALENAPKTGLGKAEPPPPPASVTPPSPTAKAPAPRAPKPTAVKPAIDQPKRATSVATMASRASATYKVSPGDTLWGIANKHRMTVNELAALNGLSATAPLKEKQTLQVIAGAATNASSAWYTVQRGDSLYSIGKRFAVPTKTLAAWNCLTGGGTIFPGQRISVAEPGAGTNCTNRG